MKDVYEDLPKLKIELNAIKFIVIIFAILVFFLVPAVFIQNNYTNSSTKGTSSSSVSSNSQNQGQIAGLSTDIQNKENQLLIIIGGILIGLSAIIIIFLLIENYRNRKFQMKQI